MKKLFLSALAIAALAVTPTMAEDVAITANQLPQEAQKFLSTNFANSKVIAATHDKDVTDNDYTVLLSDGSKIEFNSAGKWESVKNKSAQIPSALIPQQIQNYVKKNYPGIGIEKIERKLYGFEVELRNDLELKFDLKGKFLRADD